MPSTSSLSSSASEALLPVNQESQQGQSLPCEVIVAPPEPEDPNIVFDQESCSDDHVGAQAVMDNVHFKEPYPRVLLDLETPKPVGESIMSLVLQHAIITGYEPTFKHGKKRVYLDNLHSHAFNEDGILNQ